MQTTALQSSTAPLNVWLDPHPKLDGVSLIDHLFNRLDGLYPHRWRSAFANEQAIINWRESWAEGLAEEGITLPEVKCGIDACRRDFAWPPSFAEFLSACRPAIDPESAYAEAVEQLRLREHGEDKWTHRAIYWAASEIGSWDLRQSTWGGIKARWTAVLRDKLADRDLPDIPPPRVALPAPGKTEVSREDALKRLATLKTMFKGRHLKEAA
jgi:hypothetical protein